jgi:hypothetical protein
VLREAGRELKRHFWSVLTYMLSFACVVKALGRVVLCNCIGKKETRYYNRKTSVQFIIDMFIDSISFSLTIWHLEQMMWLSH